MNLTQFIIISNKSVGLDQYSSFGENKVDTIYCSSPFSLQTFDILRLSHEIGLVKTCDILPRGQHENNIDRLQISHNVNKWPGRQMLLHQLFLWEVPC